ncbi:uncharacterized protein LTR77_010368 [Saxophila tyrrhenica]|uniref:SP-RING-type domain-containing protein n=1 Tax=Saxophila tyrrhenica TaxID=1690608 RepID=A0AAV9NZV8_9PEZI|nr:hypothetical protein LTR77_010368 [Saxophila tyrrhenica]
MATRVRQSTAAPSRASTVAPTPAKSGTQLPPYEAPSFPLNPAAQRALDNLTRTHNLKKLDDSITDAQKALQDVAAGINDRLSEREKQVSKKRKAQAPDPTPDDAAEAGEEGQNLDELRDKVQRMTTRMDESIRKLIDGQHSVQAIRESIAATATDARASASTQASTQAGPTQRRRRQDGEEGDGEEDEEYQDFTPTDPRGGTQAQKTAIETFRSKLEDSKTRYQSHSLAERYAENNTYRDFRRVVHDAQHHDGDVPLAHHSDWFDEGPAPAPGMTTRARADADADDDSDDDLAVSRMTISTKCPLTLTEFKQPLTSRKCPHSFESAAILSLLSTSATRENGRAGEKIVQCPVSGCSQTLTKNDLHTDAVLVRQIKRLQRSRELEEEDGDDDQDGANGATVVEDGDDAADVDDIVEGRTQVKGEPQSGRTPAGMRRSTEEEVVEVGSQEDEEAGEGEEDGDVTQDE